jgi:hypothetical protein
MLDDIKHFTSFFVPRQILKECYSPENLPNSKNKPNTKSYDVFVTVW